MVEKLQLIKCFHISYVLWSSLSAILWILWLYLQMKGLIYSHKPTKSYYYAVPFSSYGSLWGFSVPRGGGGHRAGLHLTRRSATHISNVNDECSSLMDQSKCSTHSYSTSIYSSFSITSHSYIVGTALRGNLGFSDLPKGTKQGRPQIQGLHHQLSADRPIFSTSLATGLPHVSLIPPLLSWDQLGQEEGKQQVWSLWLLDVCVDNCLVKGPSSQFNNVFPLLPCVQKTINATFKLH